MPPSGHSHSSHSSHSSSHHSSSSHSSSSRSSSRSYSSHSSTARTRTNQPTGYTGSSHIRHYRHHDYAYYSSSWTDTNTGRYYDAGYYDENGNYYKGLTIKSGSDYTSEFTCDYCGTLGKYTWKEGAVPNCTNCGAPLTMVDSFAKDEEAPATIIHDNNYVGGISSFMKNTIIAVVFIAVISMFGSFISTLRSHNDADNDYDYSSEDQSNIDLFGDDVYLKANGDGSYSIISGSEGADKNMFFDYNNHGYYDPDTDAYLWYNVNVSPALWQYWYEGYSSKYDGYGWMEHEDDGWWIEVEDGNWSKVPDADTTEFWWIK